MYRILLADDEGIVIDSLRFIIERNFANECGIETARTGRTLIESAESFQPDIIFVDIQMPGINGISAMREIRKTNASVIFIVLSAYDNFDYAKESIELGVMEYLNKPVNQKTIVASIRRAMVKIDNKREQRRQDLIIREKMETVIPIVENGFINSMMFQYHGDESIEKYSELLEIKQDYGYMMALVFGDEQQGTYMTNVVGSSVKTQRNYAKLRELIKEAFPCVVGAIMANEIPIYLPMEKEKMEYNERIEVIEAARKLVRTLKHTFGSSFRMGIGSVKRMVESRDSYEEALKALMNADGSVSHVNDLPLFCEYEDNYPIETEKKLFEELSLGKEEACTKQAGDFFDWMVDTYGEQEECVRLKVLEFVLFAEHEAYLSGGMLYRFEGRKEYLTTINNATCNSALRPWFLQKFREASRNIAGKKKQRANSLMKEACDYIQSNYQKDISLDEISRVLDLSPYYFSKLFKETVGQSFVEYLTSLRIQEAKKLLNDNRLGMKEICQKVGYRDPNYFSRIFKKCVGITPTEYREGGHV